MQPAEAQPVALQLQVSTPFHFVAYGDARFHDPKDTEAANPAARQALVQAIAEVKPAFISFGGDIVYNGNDSNDWKVWDSETTIWRENKIPIYPALGNHDLAWRRKSRAGKLFPAFPRPEETAAIIPSAPPTPWCLCSTARWTKPPVRKANG